MTGAAGPASSGSGGGAPAEEEYVLPKTFFIGRYRVVDEIGVGGMASVHLARMDGPGGFQKWVAIKRIHPHLVEDDQFVDMFLDEARIAAGINHANVAQVFDLGKDESTYWIAMEYLHGEPLRELMRRLDEQNMIIPFGLAARICADAAEGLHGAHELRGRNGQLLNLVHRDVTPHNLFVTYDGYTKVVDFGIAKVVDRLASTRAGTLKGKLAYMSPEQVRGMEVDRRTDIFALGVVLWELTTNRRLFRMETDLDTLEKVQACIVPLPSTLVQGYPRDLEEVVMRALAQRKEDRYPTARDFSRALQGFLMRHGTIVGPEDVGEFAKRMFADRVEKREKYLEWAAEVTSTIDVSALRAEEQANASLPGAGALSAGQQSQVMAGAQPQQMPPPMPGAPMPGAPMPAAAPAPMPQRPLGAAPPLPPPPALGMPMGMPPQQPMPTPGMPPMAVGGVPQPGMPGVPSYGVPTPGAPQPVIPPPVAPPPSRHAPAGSPQAPQALPDLAATSLMEEDEDIPTRVATREEEAAKAALVGQQHELERTTAMPDWQMGAAGPAPAAGQPDDDDLSATIALHDDRQAVQIRQEIAALEQQRGPFRPQAPAPTAALPAMSPMAGYGAPGMMPEQPAAPAPDAAQAAALQPPPPQSNIETRMSMPRPAAVTQWLAEQSAYDTTGPRSTPVLMSIALLATLCVIGVGALVAYKVRVGDQQVAMVTPSGSTGGAYDPLAPEHQPGATPSSTAGAAASSTPTATRATTPTGTKVASPKGTLGPGTAPPAAATSEEGSPGFLTIYCKPACDSVTAGGRGLGASPVSNVPMPPGQHRVTCKRSGSPTKVISVIIVSGQLTSHTVTME